MGITQLCRVEAEIEGEDAPWREASRGIVHPPNELPTTFRDPGSLVALGGADISEDTQYRIQSSTGALGSACLGG